MSQPTVTVIMNCFNSDRYLREAIESVLAQTFSDWEIVFWDNQSTDSSAEIVKSYNDPRIRYHYAPKHTPLGEARNFAVAEARGVWVALLDCDDVWFPDKLEKQLAVARGRDDLGLIYSDTYFCDASGKNWGKGTDRHVMRRGKVREQLLSNRNFIPCPTVLIRRQALVEVGGFDSSLRYCEEYELFLRIAEKWSVDFVNEPLGQYRVHAGNTVGAGTIAGSEEVILVMELALKNSRSLNILTVAQIHLRIATLRLKLLWQRLRLSHQQVRPPSTETTAPVIYDEASEQRNTTAP